MAGLFLNHCSSLVQVYCMVDTWYCVLLFKSKNWLALFCQWDAEEGILQIQYNTFIFSVNLWPEGTRVGYYHMEGKGGIIHLSQILDKMDDPSGFLMSSTGVFQGEDDWVINPHSKRFVRQPSQRGSSSCSFSNFCSIVSPPPWICILPVLEHQSMSEYLASWSYVF